jgi:hypothetical protein
MIIYVLEIWNNATRESKVCNLFKEEKTAIEYTRKHKLESQFDEYILTKKEVL